MDPIGPDRPVGVNHSCFKQGSPHSQPDGVRPVPFKNMQPFRILSRKAFIRNFLIRETCHKMMRKDLPDEVVEVLQGPSDILNRKIPKPF